MVWYMGKKTVTYVLASVFMLMMLIQLIAYVAKNNSEYYRAVKYAYDKCHWSQNKDDKIIKNEEKKEVTYKIVKDNSSEYFVKAYKEYLDMHPESFLNDGYAIQFDFCDWFDGHRVNETTLILSNKDVNGNIHKEFDVGKFYCNRYSSYSICKITCVKELYLDLYYPHADEYLGLLNYFTGVEKVIVEPEYNDPEYINRITEYIEEIFPGCTIDFVIEGND